MSRHHRHRERGYVPPFLRLCVLDRADYACESCGTRGRKLESDHIIPVADGGETTMENLQALCRDCHLAKTRRESGTSEATIEWTQFANRSDFERRKDRRRASV